MDKRAGSKKKPYHETCSSKSQHRSEKRQLGRNLNDKKSKELEDMFVRKKPQKKKEKPAAALAAATVKPPPAARPKLHIPFDPSRELRKRGLPTPSNMHSLKHTRS